MKIWTVDSFTNKPFKGNPAGVMMLEKPLSEALMQNIAMEMNLSETAFITPGEAQQFNIRFFTPAAEIDLCGHATLAAAHIYFTEIDPKQDTVVFNTKSAGTLTVKKSSSGYVMEFPNRKGEKIALDKIPSYVLDAISEVKPIEAYLARDLMLVYEDEELIKKLSPDFAALKKYEKWIITTSKSKDYDFISRFFCVDDGILEDPVTGSAHCTLAPYWAETLKKTKLRAFQASNRGGELLLEVNDKNVYITGEAVTMMEGNLRLGKSGLFRDPYDH